LGEWTSQKLTPTEAQRKYLEHKNMPEECEKVLLDCGERMIWGIAKGSRKYEGWQIG
jgi:hypothetical protein